MASDTSMNDVSSVARPTTLNTFDDPGKSSLSSHDRMDENQFTRTEMPKAFKRKDEGEAVTTLRERRRKEAPLSIQVYKKQKTEHASGEQEIQQCSGPVNDAKNEDGLLDVPDYAWMARWVAVPFSRFIVNPKILYTVPLNLDNVCDQPLPTLNGLPTDILTRIFSHLDPPWQVCLALASKTFAHASCHVNSGHGLLYSRGERLRLMGCLKSWMTPTRKLCAKCEKYRPVSNKVWQERKEKGRLRTRSNIYGKTKADFNFVGENCPECTAEERWNRVHTAQMEFLKAMWAKD